MTTLTSGTFTLPLDALVTVRATAHNAYGDSTPSPVNVVGAKVRTVPVKMPDLTRGSSTTESQLQINWATLTGSDTGNSPITSYVLNWDNGSGALTDI